MVRGFCAEWCPFLPAIRSVWIMLERVLLVDAGVRVKVDNVPPWAPGRLFLTFLTVVDQSGPTVRTLASRP